MSADVGDATAIDYGCSFGYFRDTPDANGVNHLPRFQLDASCTLQPPGAAAPTRFFAGVPCATERMYTETGLIHEPMAEFRFVFSTEEQYLMLKWHADAADDKRAARWKHESMPTKAGSATLDSFYPKFRHHRKMVPVATYAEIRAAHTMEPPYTGAMNGRTSYTLDDGTRVVLDYPIKTSNTGNADESWQMDVGPLLMPLPVPHAEQRAELPIDRLSLGYLVYNRPTYAEAIVRAPTPIAGGGSVNFFSQRAALQCETTMYAAVEA